MRKDRLSLMTLTSTAFLATSISIAKLIGERNAGYYPFLIINDNITAVDTNIDLSVDVAKSGGSEIIRMDTNQNKLLYITLDTKRHIFLKNGLLEKQSEIKSLDREY